MEIIKLSPGYDERIYCPSTNEVILDQAADDLNHDAEALIGYWHDDGIDEPYCNNKTLEKEWEERYNNFLETEDDEFDVFDLLSDFLEKYENPEWKVYELRFSGMACGPISYTVWFVVKADTIIDTGPDSEDETKD